MGGRFGWVVDVFFLGPLSGGDGDGEETTSGHVHQGRFRWTTRIVKHLHFFMLYVIYLVVGGCFFMFQDHRERCPPSLDVLDRHVCVEVSTLNDLFHTLKTMEGLMTSFHHGLDGTVGRVSYTHVVYVICYFCYMLFNAHLCMHIIPLRTGGGT